MLHWVPGLGSLGGFDRSIFFFKCEKIHDAYFRDVETPFSGTLRLRHENLLLLLPQRHHFLKN